MSDNNGISNGGTLLAKITTVAAGVVFLVVGIWAFTRPDLALIARSGIAALSLLVVAGCGYFSYLDVRRYLAAGK